MSDSLTTFVSQIVGPTFFVIAVGYLLAGYWGLTFTRKLVIREYRNQALGVSIVALYFFVIGGAVRGLPVDANSGFFPILANALAEDFGYYALLIYVIYAAVSVAKRSDPYESDTLHFRSLRYVWAAAIFVLIVLALVYDPISVIYTVTAPLTLPALLLAYSYEIVFVAYGGAVLFVSASKSRDKSVQRHVKWFGTYVLLFVVIGSVGSLWRLTGGNASPYSVLIFPTFLVGQLLQAFSLYKSAKSLATTTKVL